MTSYVQPEQQPTDAVPTGDDTAAFQRFYREESTPADHGTLYRLLVGWWRRD